MFLDFMVTYYYYISFNLKIEQNKKLNKGKNIEIKEKLVGKKFYICK